MSVFVLDHRGLPLMPCSEKRARKLLASGRARVHRLVPFVVRLIDRTQQTSELQPIRLKLDPGSKYTGVALVREVSHTDTDTGETQREAVVLSLMEIKHRGNEISNSLKNRRNNRRLRRSKLRYRSARFLNRGNKKKAWLPPSLQHPIDSTLSWVKRLRLWAPITALSSELVRFDMQKMQNPEISGIEYQQGTSKGGSDRISNLTLACECCNRKKDNHPVEQFLPHKPQLLAKILAQAKKPLPDAAAVNTTRWALAKALQATGLPVELATGGRTKFNRTVLQVPKTHALDAACVGQVDQLTSPNTLTLTITASGRGLYQRIIKDKHGFRRGQRPRIKNHFGFTSGDMVNVHVTQGKKQGHYKGRVGVRSSGKFNIQTLNGLVQGIHHRYCKIIQRGDGYGYFLHKIAFKKKGSENKGLKNAALSLPDLKVQVSRVI